MNGPLKSHFQRLKNTFKSAFRKASCGSEPGDMRCAAGFPFQALDGWLIGFLEMTI
jgi:hypothetical protein